MISKHVRGLRISSMRAPIIPLFAVVMALLSTALPCWCLPTLENSETASATVPGDNIVVSITTNPIVISKTVDGSVTVYKDKADTTIDTLVDVTATPSSGDAATSVTSGGTTSFSFNTYAGGTFTVTGTSKRASSSTASRTVIMPAAESTIWVAFEYQTIGQWNAQVQPTSVDFSGIGIIEQDGGNGNDTCWFEGSQFAKQLTISHGTWAVGPSNNYGPDLVGWPSATDPSGNDLVDYYQAHAILPCGFVHNQQVGVAIFGPPGAHAIPIYQTIYSTITNQ